MKTAGLTLVEVKSQDEVQPSGMESFVITNN